MSVPEAAVDEDHGPVFWQDEVGFSREGSVEGTLDREPVAHAVEHRAQRKFRLRVPATDAGHDFGAFFRGEEVHCLGRS